MAAVKIGISKKHVYYIIPMKLLIQQFKLICHTKAFQSSDIAGFYHQRPLYLIFLGNATGGASVLSCSLPLPLLACEEERSFSEGEVPLCRWHQVGGDTFADSAANINFSEKGIRINFL